MQQGCQAPSTSPRLTLVSYDDMWVVWKIIRRLMLSKLACKRSHRWVMI